MAYDFDEDGFLIWEDRPIPKKKVGDTAPGWDTGCCIVHLNKTYQNIRKDTFDRLYKSVECKKKRRRDLEEAERKTEAQQQKEEQDRLERQ